MTGKRILALQPMPGIGDMVWHVPHLRALAEARGSGQVTLLAKPSSHADVLLAQEPWVAKILWLQRPERKKKGIWQAFSGIWRRGGMEVAGALTPSQRSAAHDSTRHDGLWGMFRLASLLRQEQFDEVWIFHGSAHYLWSTFLAQIPMRLGYGHKQLSWLLTSSNILQDGERGGLMAVRAGYFADRHALPWRRHDRPIELMSSSNAWALKYLGPQKGLRIAIGIGGTDACRKWPLASWIALIHHILKAYPHAEVFLLGGLKERLDGREIMHHFRQESHVHLILDSTIQESMALLKYMTVFIGNETATLNLAANQETIAFGLFGGMILTHSPYIRAICTDPPGQGCAAISPTKVAAMIDQFLKPGEAPLKS